MENTPELKEYQGNCHCGLFKFAIKVPDLTNVRTCDCSFCTKNGHMWIFPVADENLIIKSGGIEGLSMYEFGKKDMKHFFCPKCCSSVMGRRRKVPAGKAIGINARMLKSIDLVTLEKNPFPGQTLEPAYQPPVFASHDEHGEVEDGLKIYNGNCHCGSVTYTVKTTPLEEQKVMCCNCSLCSRNGDHFIYPSKSSVKLYGAENLTGYVFLSRDSLHSFCKFCGVSVVVQVSTEGEDIMPLNVRTIDGVGLEELQFQFYDGMSAKPLYTV